MSGSRKITELLEKTKHFDADERYMATRDLIGELKQSASIEPGLQVPVRNAILAQLDDKAPDVSTIAVKCLSQIVSQFSSEHVVYIVERLGHMIIDKSKEASLQMMADGLKTVLSSITPENGKVVVPGLVKNLLTGLAGKQDAKEITMEMVCLDCLKEVLDRYPGELTNEYQNLLSALTKLLDHPGEAVRKRASSTLGPLVTSLNDDQFSGLMSLVSTKINQSKFKDTYIQTVGVISRAAGVRVGQYLDKIVPQLEKFLKVDDAKDDDEALLELWENCLHALEAIIRKCPNKVTPHVRNIITLAIKWLQYDPNYAYDMDTTDDNKEKGGDDWGGGGDDEWGGGASSGAKKGADEWGDGAAAGGDGDLATISADSTWKVRRAAVGVLAAFIKVRSDILKEYYKELSDILISRFKERDSSVKEEILLAMRDLLHESVVSEKAAVTESKEDEGGIPEVPLFIRTRSSYETLDLKVKDILGGVEKQFAKGDTRTQKAIFAMLCELVVVRRGDLDIGTTVPNIIQGIETTGKGADINADALKLLHLILEFHQVAQLKPFMAKFASATVKLINSGNQNVVPEALRVLGSICKKLAGQPGIEQLAQDAYKAIFSQIVQKDVIQRIKLASISSMAVLLASFGSQLGKEMKNVVPVLIERLGNEVTRQPVLRAIAKICNSDSKADLSLLASNSQTIKDMSGFLRKTGPHLKNETVIALEALVRTHVNSIKPADLQGVLQEAAGYISDEDLQLTALVLNLASTSLSVAASNTSAVIAKEMLGKTLVLVKSPLLQGTALQSTIRFFQACVASGAKEMQYSTLLSSLLGVVDGSLNKTSYAAVAQCIAGTTRKAGDKQIKDSVAKFVGDIKGSNPAHANTIALLVLGNIGQHTDLSDVKGIDSTVISAMDSKDDGVRNAAAYALGNISVGNLTKFVPTWVDLVKKASAQNQYLLFASMKEALTTLTRDRSTLKAFAPHVDTLIPMLQQQAEAKDEGVRSMVASCYGLLCLVDSVKVLALLEKFLSSTSANARATMITALRFSFSPFMEWPNLAAKLDSFLSLLKDKDLAVRRETLLTLNALARANIECIRAKTLKELILPSLYEETKPKPELIHERDYGAFKETIDDGLPLRKAAFQCLGTLLDVCPHRLSMTEYINFMQQGLNDNPDIQVTTFQTFGYIALYHGSSLLEILNNLPEMLMKSIKAHMNAAKAKEPDPVAVDCLRAFLRAMMIFNKIPGVELCTKYTHFYKQVCATPILAQMQKEIDSAS